ncbi:unnamed protein product [Somion occarium]|uniref:BTB domain-containing protein n=1 Tax=Somion occarium TaxID=3059160 RepID=A0ABP1DNP9_9APHY
MNEYTRHQEFYFHDGNVVIMAEKIAFRIHQGVLSRHSTIFQDMFSLPQPSTHDEGYQIDGLPVVHVSDTADEFAHVVAALYDGGLNLRKSSNYHQPLPFSVVSAYLRLGSKYHLDALREEAIDRLKLCFPTQLKDYDPNLFDATTPTQSLQLGWRPISISRSDFIEVIGLARSFDLRYLLPSAFHACVRMNASLVIDADFCHGIFLVYSNLLALKPTSENCADPVKCREAITRHERSAVFSSSTGSFGDCLEHIRDESHAVDGLCPACCSMRKQRLEQICTHLWKGLVSISGLDALH